MPTPSSPRAKSLQPQPRLPGRPRNPLPAVDYQVIRKAVAVLRRRLSPEEFVSFEAAMGDWRAGDKWADMLEAEALAIRGLGRDGKPLKRRTGGT